MNPNRIYLTQTDTTVGLVSQNKEALKGAKQRGQDKPFIITCAGFRELKEITRVPKKYRKIVRRANKTTFVYPHKNIAARVVQSGVYHDFLKPFKWMYSTSANLSGKGFDAQFAANAADEIIGDAQDFRDNAPSKIILLAKKQKRLR